MEKKVLREHLEQIFVSKPLIFRRDPDLTSIVAGGSLANDDCKHVGPANRVTIGNKTFYPRAELIDYLVRKSSAR